MSKDECAERDPLLAPLNAAQREAATHEGGPMLVLAGAGSGKTRVITHRIAWLLRRGAPADSIVAMTFTNKAALEMKERVGRLLDGADATGLPWVGTFHAFCLRLLRREVASTPLQPRFVVIDQDDAVRLVREILRAEHLDDKTFPPSRVQGAISRAKGAGLRPGDPGMRRGGPVDEVAFRVYPTYDQRLVALNACDFDDLLLRAVHVLEEHPDVLQRWQERLHHVLVDEYQDTNAIQLRLLRLLAGRNGNPCVVGDEDQSIYRFRGADLSNILEFERHFPGTRVFRIEQNYRSTAHVLEAANAVVARNVRRKGKQLWTANEDGEKVRIQAFGSDAEEAGWVAREVAARLREVDPSDIAVLFRTNAQSRLFEETFARAGIPHVVIGTLRFYERREVKDVVAYLRLAVNPHDDLAFSRVLNVPTRGLGAAAEEALDRAAAEAGSSLWKALLDGLARAAFPTRMEGALEQFATLVEATREISRSLPVAPAVRAIVERTGYLESLAKEGELVERERRRNVEELVSAAAEHAERAPGVTLDDFLADVALASDTDALGAPGRVQLMTMHSAKGLEFDTVFLTGLEEGLFPHAQSGGKPDDVEEERRLCYVGMTRARKVLVLSHAGTRRLFGQVQVQPPSRFLAEIPPEHAVQRAPRSPGAGAGPLGSRGGSAGSVRESATAAVQAFFASGTVEAEDLPQASPYDPLEHEVPEPAPDDDAPGLRPGQQVRHDRFGVGQVLSVERLGGRTRLTVYFHSKGRVKLDPAHARLTPLR